MLKSRAARVWWLLFAAVMAPVPVGAQFNWEPRSELPVTGLWGPSTFVIDSVGYVVSGRTGNIDVAGAWAYDPASDSWSARAPIPVPRRIGAGFAINGRGYVCCGTFGSSDKLNDLWEYDPQTDSWTQRASFPGDARYGTCAFVLGGLGYVGTGNAGSAAGPYVSDMYAYDPTTDSWSSKAPMPGLPRYGTSTITASEKAFVFGGLMADQVHTDDIYEYDPVTDEWTLRAPFPGTTRTYAMALSYPNDGVIVAGKGSTNLNIYDGFSFVPNLNIWSEIPEFPGGSGWVGATMAINGRSFGGLGLISNSSLHYNDWWELVKEGAAGVNVPEDRSDALHVAPNPLFPGMAARIELPVGADPNGTVRIELVDASGRSLHEANVDLRGQWTCPELPAGSYTMRVIDRDLVRWHARVVIVNR